MEDESAHRIPEPKNFVIALRQKLGITQRELAELVDVSSTTVYRWESGESVPNRSALEGLEDLDRQHPESPRDFKRARDRDEALRSFLARARLGPLSSLESQLFQAAFEEVGIEIDRPG